MSICEDFGNRKEWRLNGSLHRIDGPAKEWADGEKQWYQNGVRHRDDGPAIENEDPEELRTRIIYEINSLPPRCSEIFKLSRFEGLKYQEIADHLDISIKTVEVQMGKALKILRDKLGDLKHKLGAS